MEAVSWTSARLSCLSHTSSYHCPQTNEGGKQFVLGRSWSEVGELWSVGRRFLGTSSAAVRVNDPHATLQLKWKQFDFLYASQLNSTRVYWLDPRTQDDWERLSAYEQEFISYLSRAGLLAEGSSLIDQLSIDWLIDWQWLIDIVTGGHCLWTLSQCYCWLSAPRLQQVTPRHAVSPVFDSVILFI